MNGKTWPVVRVAVNLEMTTSIFDARTRAKSYQRKYPYPLVAQNPGYANTNVVVEADDIDWPLMSVVAPEALEMDIDYGDGEKEATAVTGMTAVDVGEARLSRSADRSYWRWRKMERSTR